MLKYLFILLTIPTLTFASDGKITFLRGNISINGVQAELKSPLQFGDIVESSKASLAVIKVFPDTTIKLKANSRIIIPPPKMNGNKRKYSYILEHGDIFIKAKKTKGKSYSVKVKDAVMGVRGTEFFVSSSKHKKNIWMCVNEGKVSVSFSNKKDEILVKAGQGVVINSDKLPEVKEYSWTKKLNWKMQGNFQQINDSTDIQNINYNLRNFSYD